MPQNHPIDPTYLRYVYDGLAQGRISADNASDLPHGLVGLYEELFHANMPTAQRQQLLERFCTWALLRREVTTTLVAGLWQQTEEEVMDFIRTHSRWFASPKQGHYRLYHDKLRTFYLQRLAANDVSRLNRHLIAHLQEALQQQDGKDTERYGLQYLANHLYAEAMQYPEHGKQLLTLAHNTTLWQRQLNQSKGYTWTKEMLEHARHWAAQHSEQDLEECALQQIDLHYMEQNSAPQIVELVAQNDVEAALGRIQSFGGNDKEGLKRKFILYMLCLMEVTLLDSKDQPWARDAAEQLLRHFDDNLPTDHSILNWNDFFPSYLVFQVACRLAEHELDYRPIYQRTDKWESDWIAEQGPYTQLQFGVLLNCDRELSHALAPISIELAGQGLIDGAFECAAGIDNDLEKIRTLIAISVKLAKQGKIEEALACTNGITDDNWKSAALQAISIELAKQGKMEEALGYARGISHTLHKIRLLLAISTEMVSQGKEEPLEIALEKSDDSDNSSALTRSTFTKVWNFLTRRLKRTSLLAVSTERTSLNKFQEVANVTQEAIACARGISDDLDKSSALSTISVELASRGKVEEAFEIAFGISDKSDKCIALLAISTELANQGTGDFFVYTMLQEDAYSEDFVEGTENPDFEQAAASLLLKAIEIAHGITDESDRNSALSAISTELTKQGKIDITNSLLRKAHECAHCISDDYLKCRSLSAISTALTMREEMELPEYAKESVVVMDEALQSARNFFNRIYRGENWFDVFSSPYMPIYQELQNQGKVEKSELILEEAFVKGLKEREMGFLSSTDTFSSACMQYVSQGQYGKVLEAIPKKEIEYSDVLTAMSIELAKHGKIDGAIDCTDYITNEFGDKDESLKGIFNELTKQGKIEESASVIMESLGCDRGVSDDRVKSNALSFISTELAKQGKVEEALACASGISDDDYKSEAFSSISAKLAEQGEMKLAGSLLIEALEFAWGIFDLVLKSSVLQSIFLELVRQGETEYVLIVATNYYSEDVLDENFENRENEFRMAVCRYYLSEGKNARAIECARGMHPGVEYGQVMLEISRENLRKKNRKEAWAVLDEALSVFSEYSNFETSMLNPIMFYNELKTQGRNELAKSLLQNAIDHAHGITDTNEKCSNFQLISTELAKQGEINLSASLLDEIIDFVKSIPEDFGRALEQIIISDALIRLGKTDKAIATLEDALSTARSIGDIDDRVSVMTDIANELLIIGNSKQAASVMHDAFECVMDIGDENTRCRELERMCIELAKQGNWGLAQYAAVEITLQATRQDCLKQIGNNVQLSKGYREAIEVLKYFTNVEAQEYMLQGITQALQADGITKEVAHLALKLPAQKVKSMEHVLQLHAINQLFFEGLPPVQLQRYNRTLNLQWAVHTSEQQGKNLKSNDVRSIPWKALWMPKNLNVAEFRNGDLISEARSTKEWREASENGKPAWCYYKNDKETRESEGKLYNWFAVNDPRGLAPEGWAIPETAEWEAFLDSVGGNIEAARIIAEDKDWCPGSRRKNTGTFSQSTSYGWWSSSAGRTNGVAFDVSTQVNKIQRTSYHKGHGYPVKCIKSGIYSTTKTDTH